MVIGEIVAIILIPILLFSGGLFYHFNKNIKQDNQIEEVIEDIFFQQTGCSIDLSPQTPEDKDGNK